jgi:hypothetical protein
MGRAGIEHRNASGATISQNLIHDFAEQTMDTGGTLSFETDGGGTVISQNIYHDGIGLWTAGPYLDDDCSNFTVADNLVYNMDWGMMMNLPNTSIAAYNNTLAASGSSIVASGSAGSTMTGSVIENNIFTAPLALSATCTMSNNLPYTTAPGFVNVSAPPNGYELSSTSSAASAGMAIPPWTGTSGIISEGCFQYGQIPWWAGGRVSFTQFAGTGFNAETGSWVGNVGISSTCITVMTTGTGSGECLLPVALDIGGNCVEGNAYLCFAIYYTPLTGNTCPTLRVTLSSSSGSSYYDSNVSSLTIGTSYWLEPLISNGKIATGSGVDLTKVTSWRLSTGTSSGTINCNIGPVEVVPQ